MKSKIKQLSNAVMCAVASLGMLAVAITSFFNYSTEAVYAEILRNGEQVETTYSIGYNDKGDAALLYTIDGDGELRYLGVFSDDAFIEKIDLENDDTITVFINGKGESVPALYVPHTVRYISFFTVALALLAISFVACLISVLLTVRQCKLLRIIGMSPESEAKTKNTGVAGSVFKTRKSFVLSVVWMAVLLLLFGGIFVCNNLDNETATYVCIFCCVGWFLLMVIVTEIVRCKLLRKLKAAIDAQMNVGSGTQTA